ncbi:MAG TPA: DUF411 domain-containing protein [Aestuariivirga sp.]|nr:DUF411 domain-containing protein [Aestuariivirga sp.]
MTGLSRRAFALGGLLAACTMDIRPAFAARPVFYRSPGCGCCHVWTRRMAEAGLDVDLRDTDDLAGMSERLGIPSHLAGCHVGQIGSYVISGHVPPDDILRLLVEMPKAKGLLVPGMPAGSPGMETDGPADSYQVLLLHEDSSTEVFASYG